MPSETVVEGPDKLWEGNPEALIPHEQVKAALADWITEKYRAKWDENSPKYGAEFFLKRDAGLKAYATYEADYYLRAPGRHSAVESKRGCPEKWREVDFSECMLIEEISRIGAEALSGGRFAFIAEIKAKEGDKSFFIKLGKWLERESNEWQPSEQIQRYAHAYARCIFPFEFCTDEFAAHVLSYVDQRNEKDIDVDHESGKIRKWRTKSLNLPLTKPVAAKWLPKRAKPSAIREAVLHHQIPF